jgi:hypothetical protein
MNFGGRQKGELVGEKAPALLMGRRRAAVHCLTNVAPIFAVALALTFAFSEKAQSQSPAQTTAPAPTPTQSPTPAETPAPAPDTPPGRTEGNYVIQQSVEAGYRDSMIGGNLSNYDTFEDYNSGMRLFDYTVDMRSVNHEGILFDTLSFSNFGYGGDPNDVSRLHIQKNKAYDFRAMFRRDKDYWNYNLLANPLNPAVSTPAVAIVNSPQALNLSRRMQDYDLIILPQSRLRFRLGYSRNTDTGPASATLEGGTEPLLTNMVNYITNSYRMGVDYRGLSKTTLSFDELLTYSQISNTVTDNNLTYQLSNGTPVDLGLVFNTVGSSPCAAPITNALTVPPTANANCNGYLSYSQVENPRSSFPTERFSFQSTYVKNLTMTGSVGYSSGANTITGFDEDIDGYTSRTITRASTTAGPAQAKRISVNADWTGEYRLTEKLSLTDQIAFEDWRIPSMWATAETNLFATLPAAPGQTGLLLPISMVTPATFATICPAPYTGAGCPQHNTSSGADVTNQLVSQFLGQNVLTNTIELKYDFTRRVSAGIGYLYRTRAINDFTATFNTGVIYFPGGATATPANDYLAARGSCALVAGALPAGCVLNANGSIQVGTPATLVPVAGNDTALNDYNIHESAGLFNISARPTDSLRFGADLMFGYNDNSFTRVSPRQIQSYKVHANYTPKPWATLGASLDIHENRDNVAEVNNIEHGRAYNLMATLSPKSTFYVDFGYTYIDMYTQTEICFADTASPIFTAPCPIPAATGPLGTLSFYESTDQYAYANVMWKPQKRVAAMVGYAGSIVRGNTTFLNPLTPTGTLDFNYLKPLASIAIDIYRGLSWKTAWNYYGYDDHGVANPAGLAALPSQNFNGSNVTLSLKYLF